ncbi:MAG: hypothetical protein M1457_02555, partial [bacterium]|nr:hypothetical protein [bacterium]
MYTTSRNYVHRLWQIALALATLVVWGAGAATAQVAVIIAPAANDEVRGDGADDKNLIRWTISQAPDFQYIIQITEMDQSNPSQPIASPISFTIPFPQSPGSGIVNEGNNTYSLPFDFNRSELSAVGSGLFRITLRATSFGGAFDTISDPVLYNKGRPHPAFSMNTDDPAHVKFTLNAGDPDATPDYRYRLSFARVGGGSAPGPMTFTTNATSVNESAFANLALAAGAVYDVTLEVSDTQNQPVAFAGQGLSKSITQQVVVNAPPVVAIQSPPSGTVINAPNLPYSSPFDITATDDSGQPINLEVDVNGDGVPEATGVVASGGTTTINVPFTTSGAKTVRVRVTAVP